MESKFDRLFKWSENTIKIVMNNRFVSIGCFLVQGFFYLFSPIGSLKWDIGIFLILLAIYSIASLIRVSTGYGKQENIAGDIVKGYIENKKDSVIERKNFLTNGKEINYYENASERNFNKSLKNLSIKKDRIIPKGKKFLITIYILLLITSIVLFFWKDMSLYLLHIIVGLLLIFDGISSLIANISAKRKGIFLKSENISFAINIISIILGLVFLFTSWTRIIVIQVLGAMLVVKSIVEYIIAFQNKEIISSIKTTIKEIKLQK